MAGIIVGADGSAHSLRALEWAIREAGIRRTSLTVLAVYRALPDYWGAVTSPGAHVLAEDARKTAQEAADRLLDQAGARSRPLSVTVQEANGLPAEEILKAADDMDADMIVVGARGAGGFKKLLLGSVSTHVTHHAHCPVVVIPAEDRGNGERPVPNGRDW
jgi:nucleotide-binding universal stress UspA family protein